MSENSSPHFANVVQMIGMSGGNAHAVNGYYVPTSARLFGFPIYTKYSQQDNCMTTTKLCLCFENRRYYWVVRRCDDMIIAKVKYPNLPQTSLSLPEHVGDSMIWKLRSTGFFGNFKSKHSARIKICDNNTLLQTMSCFIGPGSGYMASVSESIRFIDSTVQDLEALLLSSSPVEGSSHSHTDDHPHPNSDLANIEADDMSLDEIIALYSEEIFNGYGALLPRERLISFATVQSKLEDKVSSALSAALDSEKLLAQLSDLAPEEFLDPITLVLMVQPMTLPTSPHVLDRQTLVEHLAINPTDPFNRKPLTMEMIYPDVGLKIRIDDWLFSQGVVLP